MAQLGTPPTPLPSGWVEVVVLGEAGVGKSSLINALLPQPAAVSGVGSAMTSDVARYRASAYQLMLWDTPGLSYGAQPPVAQLRTILEAVSARGGAPTMAWFAWAASSVRLTDGHRELLEELSGRGIAVLAVLTKSALRGRTVHAGHAEFASFISTAGLPLAVPTPFLVAAIADPWTGLDAAGLTGLVAATHWVSRPGPGTSRQGP